MTPFGFECVDCQCIERQVLCPNKFSSFRSPPAPAGGHFQLGNPSVRILGRQFTRQKPPRKCR